MATRNPDHSLVPEDIIYNILLRLPVKVLSRLTLVCKSWLSLISSRDFVKTHLSISTNDPNFTHHRLLLRVKIYVGNRDQNLDLRSLSVYSLLNEPVTEAIDYPMKGSAGCVRGCVRGRVEGYCHGLVCLSTKIYDHDFSKKKINKDHDHRVHLWNPFTRKSRTLPKLDHMIDDCCPIVYGFCYDESNDDYKVFINSPYDRFGYKYKVSVYSSKSDSWRTIEDFPFEGTIYDNGKFANGAMHWIVARPNMSVDDPESMIIVSLDIKTETYREILPPKSEKGAYNWTLDTFGESLSMLCRFQTRVDFWVLKECGLEESWTKLFTLPFKRKETWNNSTLASVSISVDGDIILIFHSGIKLYNLKDGTFKKYFHCVQEDVDTYVESLVSP